MRSFAVAFLLLIAGAAHAGSVETPLPAETPHPTPDATPQPTAVATPETTPDPTPEPTPAAIPDATPVPPGEEYLEPVLPRRPGIAGWLALAFPGLGHLYLREPGRGAIFLGAEAAELGAIVTTITTSGWDPENPADTRYQRALLPTAWLQNTHLLGVYDAWRIARMRAPAGTWRTIPEPSTARMLLAPFSGRQLTRPAVVVPLALVWGVGIGLATQVESGEAKYTELTRIPVFSREVDREVALAVAGGYYSATFYSVGIGEEALFRGVIQTALEERWGPTWGWVAATAFFASLHAANGATLGESAIAVGATSLIGGYLGWLYQRDGYDLTGPVFFHVWYDVGIGITTFLLDPEHQPFTAGVSIPF